MPNDNAIKTINLYIMGKKGFNSLKSLIKNCPELINAVISARDKNILEDFYDENKLLCIKNGITFYDRLDNFFDTVPFSIAISWRWLINKTTGKLIVLHDSLLPKYRGFNPLVSYLINGEKEIGVTAIFSSENYDEGDIIVQSSRKINYSIKIKDGIDLISECYVDILLDITHKISKNENIVATKQNVDEATYSLWRDDEDYFIDWNRDSHYIKRFVDASGYPYKYACTSIDSYIIRVKDVEVVGDVIIENRVPGKIIFLKNGLPVVVCGSGLIRIRDAFYEDLKKEFFPFNKLRTKFGS
jgi:methionyl-tRNA formyltransferase